MNINLVKQKHSKGCGVACLSMITNRPYDDIFTEFFGTHGKCEGMFLSDMQKYLLSNNFVDIPIIYPLTLETTEEYKSAIKPRTEVHIVQIRVFKDSPGDHFIIMDSGGKLFDPMFGLTNWEDYYERPNSIKGFKSIRYEFNNR